MDQCAAGAEAEVRIFLQEDIPALRQETGPVRSQAKCPLDVSLQEFFFLMHMRLEKKSLKENSTLTLKNKFFLSNPLLKILILLLVNWLMVRYRNLVRMYLLQKFVELR